MTRLACWLIPILVLTVGCERPAERADSTPAETGHAGSSAEASSHPGDSTHQALTLRPIMQGLAREMSTLTLALWIEDHAAMTAAAGAIAHHPHIAAEELARVQRILGSDFALFETIDRNVHEGAVRLHGAAEARDLDAIVGTLGEVQRGCVACHTRFRERLRTDAPTAPDSGR